MEEECISPLIKRELKPLYNQLSRRDSNPQIEGNDF